MKMFRKIVVGLLTAAILLAAVFLSGRYGWKALGFRACQGAGIESVSVSDHAVEIRGFYPGSFPEGLKVYTFPESEWAMFSAKGSLPGSLQALNTYIWQEWCQNGGKRYMSNGNAMLEVYTPGDMQSPDYECGIWVPVRRK